MKDQRGFFPLKIGDKLVVVFVIVLSVIFAFSFFGKSASSKVLEIKADSAVYKKIPLNGQSLEVPVQSNEGHLIVEVQNDRVRVVDSTCKDHLCVKQGWIDRVGESIVCLPNRISVSIIGGASGIDSTTY